MTKLPTDKELATNKPKDKGGDGVIVTPSHAVAHEIE